MLIRRKFDGLSLEWQFPVCWQSDCKKGSSKDKEGFVSLVKELKKAFQPKDLILAAGLSGKAKVWFICDIFFSKIFMTYCDKKLFYRSRTNFEIRG